MPYASFNLVSMHYRGLIASHCTLYIHSIYPVIFKSHLFDIYIQKKRRLFVVCLYSVSELPEYKRSALEVMRQPLEDRHITVARTKETVDYPASFMLVAAMNPCPCGHYGENNPAHPCTCTPAQVHRYMSKISGPLLDRIDIQCEIEAVPYEQLRDTQPGESSAVMRERVLRARAIQTARFQHSKLVHCNAMMTSKMVRQYCASDDDCDKLLEFTMNKLGLSARAYDRILKVARTIADIEGEQHIRKNHLLEAVSYRSLDRNNWGG